MGLSAPSAAAISPRLEELRLRRYPRWWDLLKLTLYAILENFGYRRLNMLWWTMAIASFLRKNTDWGAMERKGFEVKERVAKSGGRVGKRSTDA